MSDAGVDAPRDKPKVATEQPVTAKTVRMKVGGNNTSFVVPDLGITVTSEGTDVPADKADAVRDAAKNTPGTVLIEED